MGKSLGRSGTSSVPEKYKAFCCPLCGSKEYNQHTASNRVFGPKGRTWVTGGSCARCKKCFSDPEKFTKKKWRVRFLSLLKKWFEH